MMICRGTPTMTGRYAVYVDDYTVPTKFLTFCVGTGWFNNLKEPAYERINGWIGPFPTFHFDNAKPAPSLEFDL